MIIEPLKNEDVEKVAVACIEYAQEIGEPYNEDYIKATLTKISDGKLPVLVAKNEAGEVMGVSAFVCVPHLYNPDIMQARECIWHTSPKLSRFARARLQKDLLEIMMMTCQKQGISLFVSIPENSSMADLLASRGFKVKNILYEKESS